MKGLNRIFEFQHDESDCGVAYLSMVNKYYGGAASIESLRRLSGTSIDGTTLLGLIQASNSIGLFSEAYEATIEALKDQKSPIILHVLKNKRYEHYVVCFGWHDNYFIIADPEEGIKNFSQEELLAIWQSKVLLTFIPTEKFQKEKQTLSRKIDFIKTILASNQNLLVSSLTLGLLVAFLNLSTAIFIEKLIDVLIPSGDNLKILLALFSWGTILIVRTIISLFRDISLIKLSFNVQSTLTGVYLQKLLRLPKDFFDGRKSGDLSSRLNDMERIQSSLSNLLGQDVIDILTLICSISFILFYNLSIGLFIVGLIPVYFIIIYSVQRKVYKYNQSIMQTFATAESDYLDSLSGISAIKICNKESFFFERIFTGFNIYLRNVKEMSSAIAKHRTLNDFLGILALVFVVLFSISIVFINEMQVGDLVAILNIVALSFAVITRLAISITRFQETRVAFERAYEIISVDNEYDFESKQPVHTEDFNSIKVSDISFGFPGRENLFENINIKIKRGSLSVLFGSIGTGKSTLLQILQKFYQANSGQILVDEIDLNNINTNFWRSHIGIVPQDTKIFNDTLAFNIGLNSDFKLNDIIDFCKIYGFDQFFASLPQQYETILGEGGVRLSGGQKQILALSRALFRKPKFLLLDEPTSSLDYKTEDFIILLLRELKVKIGILVITHKREAELFADYVFYLDKESNDVALS